MSVIALTWQDFCAQFKPKRNHFVRECAYGSMLFGAFGQELEYVEQQPNEHLFVLHLQQLCAGSEPEPTISSVVGLGSTIEPLGYFIVTNPVMRSPDYQSYYFVTFSEEELESNECMQPAPPEPVTITYESFIEVYQPVQNHLHDNAALAGCMYETFGEELNAVRQANPECVWTYHTGDHGENIIVSGAHFVNRLGYIITEKSCPLHQVITVELDDIWEKAADYIQNYLLCDEPDEAQWFILQCSERGDLAAAAVHLLHTSFAGKYDPVNFINQINNRSLEEIYG